MEESRPARMDIRSVVFGAKPQKGTAVGLVSLQERSADLRGVKRGSLALETLREVLEAQGVDVDATLSKIGGGPLKCAEEAEEGENIDLQAPLKRFLPLGDLLKKVAAQPAFVCCVENMPVHVLAHKSMVECVLSYLVFVCIGKTRVLCSGVGVEMDKEYAWGMVTNESYVHPRQVFAYFEDVLVLYLFQKLLNGLEIDGKTVLVHVDKDIATKVLPAIEERFDIEEGESMEKLRADLEVRIAAIKQTVEQDEAESGGVDTYTRMYNSYKIEPRDMAHIPADMQETVKHSLIEFRLHALKVQKELREKRLLEDKAKADSILNAVHEDDPMDGSGSADGDDWEKELEREREARAKEDRDLQPQLAQYAKKENARIKQYERYLSSVKHDKYMEEYVPRARKQFLARFVDPVKDTNNSIDKNFTYYTVHANYLKFRAKKRQEEERLDEEDRKREEDEISNNTSLSASVTPQNP